MKRFMILHIGFENPTQEMMEAWKNWFDSISACEVERGGFAGGREITEAGTRDLPWDTDALTGYNIIEAESLDAAEKIAQGVPFIKSVRVYELRSH